MPTKINQADGPFDSYINSSADYLAEGTPTNATRLGLTAIEASDWDTRRTNWSLIYAKHKDESKRTKTITAEKDDQKTAFVQFATPLLIRMSVSPELTNDDRGALHLPKRDAATNRSKIDTSPFAKINPMEGGELKIRVRTTSDGNRSSMHPDADYLEMHYALVAKGSDPAATAPADPTNPIPHADTTATKVTVPETAADCPNSKISKRAIFVLKVGPENSGKRIYAFFRWVNASKEENSGSWGMAVQSVVV